MRKQLLYALMSATLLTFVQSVSAQTCTSSKNGGAAFAATWGGTPPGSCTEFVINHLVILTGDFNFDGVSITLNGPNGILLMTGGADLSLVNSTITINNGATFLLLGEVMLDNTPLIINAGGGLLGSGSISANGYTYPGDGTFQDIVNSGGLKVSGALPIELTSFSGTRIGNAIHLAWHTATEYNNALMAVERSQDGQQFIEIGQRRGAGNSDVPRDYTFVDEQPLSGVNYYRLRQEDYDGATQYHDVIAVLYNKQQVVDLTVFPTATSDLLHITLAEEAENDGVIYIADLTGRIVLQQSFARGMQQQSLDVNVLPQGHYILTIRSGRIVKTARFVKL